MPIFETPEWVSAHIDIVSGDITLLAWDRPTTEVDIQPASRRGEDVRAAEQALVHYDGGRLLVRQDGERRSWWGGGGSIRVTISVPEGSTAEIATKDGDVRSTGRLGDVRLKTGDGSVLLGDTGTCRVATADGDVRIGSVVGDLEIRTADGDIEVAAVTGRANLDSGDGDVRVGAIGGQLTLRTGDGDIHVAGLDGTAHLRSADGSITIDGCAGEVDAVTADGDIRVRRAAEGTMRLSTRDGDIMVGVQRGTSAWLDLDTADGDVSSELDDVGGPADGSCIVRVHARTSSGDIVIGRDGPADLQDVVRSA